MITKLSERHAPLAQLDRASGYGPEGRGFESLTAYQVVLPKDAAPENTARKCGVFSFYAMF